jgi:hypothetical protein
MEEFGLDSSVRRQDQWWNPVNTVVNFLVPYNVTSYLTSLRTINFSGRNPPAEALN